jgi:magnesium transporter
VPIVDDAVYVDGSRVAGMDSLAGSHQLVREQGGLAWIGLHTPTEEEFADLARRFDLHPLAVEDAVQAHQRPKLEQYGDTLFVVLRPVRYLDSKEELDFGELHVFTGPDFVLTVRHGEPGELRPVRTRLENERELLSHGALAVLYAILDRVVDDYGPVVDGLENDIDEIETEVFGRDPAVSQRIYELSREVVDFQRATRPLGSVVAGLIGTIEKNGPHRELRRSLRDVQDHLVQVNERVEGFRQLLQSVLSVNATLVSQQQNDEMKRLTEVSVAQNEEVKKISAWAAILFAPTLVGTVYGMNFIHMPELDWYLGYPMALALMLVVCFALYAVFKRRRWL